jgi:hypothetical protein
LIILDTRGRKAKIYPQNEINDIIYRFTQEEKVSGWIKYSDVFRYANSLYEKGELPYKLSEDYWRRQGRQGKESIENVNKLYENTLVNEKTSEIDIYVDTEECVNKYFTGKPSDKKRLIEALKINEKKAKDSNKLLMKIDRLQQDNKEVNAQKKELEAQINQYQKILFSWFNASLKTDVPLINLMTTGSSRHPIIDMFFETAFANPMEGYEKFEEYRRNSKPHENPIIHEKQINVVTPIKKTRLQAISEKYEEKE